MGVKVGPKVVKDGLIFAIDAAVSRSYSGSGQTTYGLIDDYRGTLLNGVGFTSANNGSFVFDGTNDYITFDYDIMGSTYTQNIWFKLNVLQPSLLIDQGWSAAVVHSNYVAFYYTNVSPVFFSASFTFTTDRWYMINLVRGADVKSVYIDGNFIASSNTSDAFDPFWTTMYVGSNVGSIQFLNGNISQIQIYNRALSAQEILQNYNATKRRYGL
jgi:hypothetical protein